MTATLFACLCTATFVDAKWPPSLCAVRLDRMGVPDSGLSACGVGQQQPIVERDMSVHTISQFRCHKHPWCVVVAALTLFCSCQLANGGWLGDFIYSVTPSYGNYCGPNMEYGGPESLLCPYPIDLTDAACARHDYIYANTTDADAFTRALADLELASVFATTPDTSIDSLVYSKLGAAAMPLQAAWWTWSGLSEQATRVWQPLHGEIVEAARLMAERSEFTGQHQYPSPIATSYSWSSTNDYAWSSTNDFTWSSASHYTYPNYCEFSDGSVRTYSYTVPSYIFADGQLTYSPRTVVATNSGFRYVAPRFEYPSYMKAR